MIEIKLGLPNLTHWTSAREQQMFEYYAASGQVWQGLADGELIACWGVIPPSFMSDSAYLWLLNLPCPRPLVLARHSREVIDALLARWPQLHGHCHLGSSSMRWLGWLGAEFGQPLEGLIPFEIRKAANG